MAFVEIAANSASGGYDIDNSCRFDSASSGYMYKSHSASQTKKFTISFWIKRGKLGTSQRIFHTGDSSGDPAYFINFDSSDRLFIGDIVQKLDGEIVKHTNFASMIARKAPGTIIVLEVLRDGKIVNVEITLMER